MFSSSRQFKTSSKSFSKSQKVNKSSSSFSKDSGVTKRRHEPRHRRPTTASSSTTADTMMSKYVPTFLPHFFFYSPTDSWNNSTSSIITLVVGSEKRLFAAHEDVLCASPYFASALRNGYLDPVTKRIALPDEEPEIFSSILEYLYKGDYFPRLVHNKRRHSYELEQIHDDERGSVESTVYHHGVDGDLLRDTVIYCAAERYGLDELKKISLRKQGLREFWPVRVNVAPCACLTFVFKSPESSAAPSCPLLATPTPTHPTATRSSAHTILPSSSARAPPSSAAARCSWRCSTAAPSSFLTYSWP